MEFLENALLAPVYYAGLFDGEGSVGLYQTNKSTKKGIIKYPQLQVKLTNSFYEVLPIIMNKFGGSIYNNKAASKNKLWMDAYSWMSYADNAYTFLEWIYPYTMIKREQIEILTEFWKIYQPYRQNKYMRLDQAVIDDYIQKIKNLKRG